MNINNQLVQKEQNEAPETETKSLCNVLLELNQGLQNEYGTIIANKYVMQLRKRNENLAKNSYQTHHDFSYKNNWPITLMTTKSSLKIN